MIKKLIPKKKSGQELNQGNISEPVNFMKKNEAGVQVAHKYTKKVKKNGAKNVGQDFDRARVNAIKLHQLVKGESAVAKVVRKAASIADLMTEEDMMADLRVFREAKEAHTQYYDIGEKARVTVPDYRTRIAAATLSRAYGEGTPVQRSMVITANFDSADKTIAKIKESPELLKAIAALQGVGLTLENGAGEVIDIDIETAVQKTGLENIDDLIE